MAEYGVKHIPCYFAQVYISDIKDVPPETMSFLEEAAAVGIDLFMTDALSRKGHPTHMSLDEALQLVRKLRPARSQLTDRLTWKEVRDWTWISWIYGSLNLFGGLQRGIETDKRMLEKLVDRIKSFFQLTTKQVI